MGLEQKLGLLGLTAVTALSSAGVLQPLQERVDWQNRQSIVHEYLPSDDGLVSVVCTDGDILDATDLNANSLGDDFASAGTSGQAYHVFYIVVASALGQESQAMHAHKRGCIALWDTRRSNALRHDTDSQGTIQITLGVIVWEKIQNLHKPRPLLNCMLSHQV